MRRGPLRLIASSYSRGNRHSGDANHRYAFRNISSHDCIGAYGCFVANLDAAEDGYTSSQPDLLADLDPFCTIARVANGPVGITGMICITDARVFTDHAAFSDAHPSYGYDVCAARNDYPVAKLDPSISMGFQMYVRVKEHILADTDATASVNRNPTQNDDGCRQLFVQSRGKKSMGIDAFGSLCSGAVMRRSPRVGCSVHS